MVFKSIVLSSNNLWQNEGDRELEIKAFGNFCNI